MKYFEFGSKSPYATLNHSSKIDAAAFHLPTNSVALYVSNYFRASNSQISIYDKNGYVTSVLNHYMHTYPGSILVGQKQSVVNGLVFHPIKPILAAISGDHKLDKTQSNEASNLISLFCLHS